MSVSARRRLTRLVRTGSPRVVAGAIRRELASRRAEADVARAAREGRRLLVGPFIGEVGFELLYWIPVARRILAEHGVGPDRVTVLSRGGAGAWYGDLAGRSVEILDIVPPDRYLAELVDRRRRTGDAKQVFSDELDERLAREATARDGDATVVHPLLMFSRMRFVLEGLEPPERAVEIGDYGPLAPPVVELPAECPEDFVAVKLYFSDSFPDDPETRALTARLLERLAAETDVVVLTSGQQLDEHREWAPAGSRIHDASSWVTPQDNLAVQTAVVARARALVATYGGFSYLGPMLGVPTFAVHTREAFLPVHPHVMRAAYPVADYTLAGPGEADGAARFVERVAGSGAVIVETSGLLALAGQVAMVSGGFDPLHPGHVAYFREAAGLGVPLLCNVSSDDWVACKHPPLLTQAERVQLIDAIRYVDYTHAETTTTEEVLALLRPRYFAKGADWEGRLPEEEVRVCAEHGVEIVFLDTVLDSSTDVLRRFSERG